MNKKEIKELLEVEREILLIKKKSEETFLCYFLSNIYLINFLFLLRKEKFDYLIITDKRLVTINKNKLIKNVTIEKNKEIKFNSIVPEIKICSKGKNTSRIGLEFLRFSYEEIQKIKEKI